MTDLADTVLDPCLLGYHNAFADATLTPLGAPFQATLPITNMLPSGRRGYPARTADANPTNTKWKVTLPQSRRISAIDMLGTNISTEGKVRYRGYDDAGLTTLLVDQGWVNAWPTIYNVDELEWEDDNFWTGTVAEAERADYPSQHPWILATPMASKYWTVEINDPTNPAGVIDIRRLYGARTFQPAFNMGWGAALGWKHRAVFTVADGGMEFSRAQSKRRIQRFALEELSEAEAMARVFEIQRAAGVTGEMLWFFNPKDDRHLIRRSFLCRFEDTQPISYPVYGAWRVEGSLLEVPL